MATYEQRMHAGPAGPKCHTATGNPDSLSLSSAAKPLTKARRGPGRVSEAWPTSRQVNPVGLALIRAAPWLHRQAPLRREPAGKSELRIAKERLYPTPRLRQCQPSKRSSPGKGGHVSPDSTALAPPLSTSFCPCQLRVTASEDTPPRRW